MHISVDKVPNLMVRSGQVACSPLASTSIEKDLSKGFAMVKQKRALLPLTVVIRSGPYQVGQTIWVRGESIKHAWISHILEVVELGIKFILVPEDAIVLYEDLESISVPMNSSSAGEM